MVEILSPKNRLLKGFWGRVNVTVASECWDWTGGRTGDGYGTLKIFKRISSAAHRVAWALENGREPGSMVIGHSCHNPLCCNPAHLFCATRAEWMARQVQNGRARGRYSKPKIPSFTGDAPGWPDTDGGRNG